MPKRGWPGQSAVRALFTCYYSRWLGKSKGFATVAFGIGKGYTSPEASLAEKSLCSALLPQNGGKLAELDIPPQGGSLWQISRFSK